MKTILKTLTGLALVFVLASPAMANITFSDLVEGNSWTITGYTSGIGSFDLEAARMVSMGDAFESPAVDGFRDAANVPIAGWALVLDNPTLVSFAGPAVTYLKKDIHFAGDASDPLTYDWVVFSGNTRIFEVRASWSGTSWSYNTQGQYWQPARADVIPAPGAILLGAIGVGLVGWLKRRRMM